MPNDVEVLMDCGGAIRQKGSSDRLYSDGFGSCTAIYAYTDKGLFGLYHLRSTLERPSEMPNNNGDANAPYRKWIEDLKEQAGGETLHFQLGSPWLNIGQNQVTRRHPAPGMANYLKSLCRKFGIENYDITMMSMVGVNSVWVDKNGLTCRGYNKQVVPIQPSPYQNDEDLLEHSGYSTAACINLLKADPNADFDGELLTKYEEKFEQELLAKKQRALKAKLQALEETKEKEANAIKLPLLDSVKAVMNRYEQNLENNPQQDDSAMRDFMFVKLLSQAVDLADLDALRQLKINRDFKDITENVLDYGKYKQIEKTELGKLFDDAEDKLSQIQSILSDEPVNVKGQDNGLALH